MNLQLSFPDQSQSFTYGVEFGRILEQIERGEPVISNHRFPIREANKSLITDACKLHNYTPVFGREWEGWVEFVGLKTLNN